MSLQSIGYNTKLESTINKICFALKNFQLLLDLAKVKHAKILISNDWSLRDYKKKLAAIKMNEDSQTLSCVHQNIH